MNQHLYLDIETIPAQRLDVIDEIRAEKQADLDSNILAIRPPGNIKKPESIAAWMTDEAPGKKQQLLDAFEADVDAAYRKTGLDGAFGQICVIGFSIGDEEPRTIWSPEWAAPNCEGELLEDFACVLTDLIPANMARAMCVVGHNVAGFDLRYLAQRSIIKGIRPHQIIASAAQAKPWESDKVFDTMVQWAGVGNRVKLDKLCKALSIPTPKKGIDGSKVWDEVKAGRIADVAEYCADDVLATRAVHRRMTFCPDQAPMGFEDVPA